MKIALENKTAGGEVKLNVYCQETEPTNKSGIWLETDKELNSIEFTEGVVGTMDWDISQSFKTPPFTPRSSVSCLVGDSIYCFQTNCAYRYDIKSNVFEQLATPTITTSNGCAIYIEATNEIIIWSGNNGDTYKYNIVNNSYTTLNSAPTNYTVYSNVFLYNNKIYLFLCTRYQGAVNLYEYDYTNDTYTVLKSSTGVLAGGKAALIGNVVYFYGNQSGYKPAQGYRNYSKSFNLETFVTQSIVDTDLNWNGGISYCFSYDKYVVAIGDLSYNGIIYDEEKQEKVGEVLISNNQTYPILGDGTGVAYGNTLIFFTSFNYTTQKRFVLDIREYTDKSVVITQGISNSLKTNIVNTYPSMNFYFNDVKYYTLQDKFDDTIPTYYGNGTQWVKFKN